MSYIVEFLILTKTDSRISWMQDKLIERRNKISCMHNWAIKTGCRISWMHDRLIKRRNRISWMHNRIISTGSRIS